MVIQQMVTVKKTSLLQNNLGAVGSPSQMSWRDQYWEFIYLHCMYNFNSKF